MSSLRAKAAASALLILACAGLASLLKPVGSAAAGQSTAVVGSLPVAPVRPVTDDYYGTKIVDPYRYMENLKDPEVRAWMKAQNDYTRAMPASIPGRRQLLARLRELDRSAPVQVSDVRRLPGDVYFYQKLIAGEDVAKLYVRQGLSGEEKLVADPGKVKLEPSSQSKGKNAIDYYSPSLDARYVAVGIVPGGSERDTEIHVFETASGRETGDVVLQAEDEGSLHWLPDNRSFVYGQLQKLPPGAPVTEVKQTGARSQTLGTMSRTWPYTEMTSTC